MQTLKLTCQALVTNVNVRLEGSRAEGEQVPALDLKCLATVPGMTVLPALLGCPTDTARGFWTTTADRATIPAFPKLGQMSSGAVFENCNGKIERHKYQAVRARGFYFTLLDDEMINLVFTLAFSGLSDAGSGHLCAMYKQAVKVEIESAQVDAFDDHEPLDAA